ncbi:hypothetical protein BH09ACT12_BH09ACT12_11580 [soil metagenome]
MRALLHGAVVAAALSLAPVAVVTTTAAPAHAATTVHTKTTFQSDVRKHGEYGGTFIVSGEVTTLDDPDGYGPLAGTAYLQRLAPGSKSWKNVASDDSPGYAYFPNYDKYKGNAKFRIYYTGGTYDAGSSGERNYPPSVSGVIKVKVTRKMTLKDVSKRQPTAIVKVSPKFGGKKILVQKKKGKKGWKTFRKVKTNKKGKARISFKGSRKGTPYRVVAPGNKQFVATKNSFKAYTY